MINYTSDNIWLLCKLKGSVIPAATLQALPGTIFALALCLMQEWWPEFREESGWAGLAFIGLTWNAMTAGISMLIALRIKQSLGRFWEGTSLLHQMRGEWFDAASCLITFSRDAKFRNNMEIEVDKFRFTLIRLMSLMHGSALDEISDNPDVNYEVIDITGLDTLTLMFLRDCQRRCNFTKVEALQHFIQVLVTDAHHHGILSIPPPILSRVYQTLSRGFVNLLNARKIKDTMFPFPFVQTIKVLLLVHTFVTPAVMTSVLNTNLWALLFTFVPLFGLHCLNLTAWQLEMPFGLDPNDLPLQQFQQEMNNTLLLLICDGADHCPGTSAISSNLSLELPTAAVSQEITHDGNSRSVERASFFVAKQSAERRKTEQHTVEQTRCPTSSSLLETTSSVQTGPHVSKNTYTSSQSNSHSRGSRNSKPTIKTPSNTKTFLEHGFFDSRSVELDSNPYLSRGSGLQQSDASDSNYAFSSPTPTNRASSGSKTSKNTANTGQSSMSLHLSRQEDSRESILPDKRYLSWHKMESLPTIYSGPLRQTSEPVISIPVADFEKPSEVSVHASTPPGKLGAPRLRKRSSGKVHTPTDGDSKSFLPFSATRSRGRSSDVTEGSPKSVQLGVVGLDKPADDDYVADYRGGLTEAREAPPARRALQ